MEQLIKKIRQRAENKIEPFLAQVSQLVPIRKGSF